MNEPVAAKFLRAMISSASTARYSSDACLARMPRERRVEIAQLIARVAGLAQLVAARQRERLDPVANRWVGVVGEPRRRLHDVRIGIVNESIRDVRHGAILPGSGPSGR